MKTQTEITAVAIYKVTVKESGKVCYAVPGDSNPNLHYITCFDEKSSNWTCTCTSGQFCEKRGQSANCKHAKAAQVSILANKQAEAERKAQEAEAMFRSLATSNAPKLSDAEAGAWFLSLGRAEDERKAVQMLSREAFQDEFSPCTVPGMY